MIGIEILDQTGLQILKPGLLTLDQKTDFIYLFFKLY